MCLDVPLIVSKDASLVAQVARSLKQHRDCRVSSVAVTSHDVDQNLAETPSSVFLDLRRTAEAEEILWAWHDWAQRKEHPIPLIGLCESGWSPRLSAIADEVLSRSLQLPLSNTNFSLILENAEGTARNKRFAQTQRVETYTERVPVTTYSASMFPVVEQLLVAAGHDLTVLFEGETGTGKTTLARTIHDLSTRRKERFLTVGCGGLSNELVHSELFGHVKGAFTGADRNKIGKFEAAEGGTILLDEIDCVGMQQQAKLLRVLETGEFEPLGSNETRIARARIVVASNIHLEKLIAHGQFRADLYYRLNQVKLELPALRHRADDIVPLAMQFIEEFCNENNVEIRCVDPQVLTALKRYSWPGNIRQLRNEISRAVLMSREGSLTLKDLAGPIAQHASCAPERIGLTASDGGLANEVAQTEREAIELMLRTQNNNRAATARALGISRVTLYNKLRKYRIQVD